MKKALFLLVAALFGGIVNSQSQTPYFELSAMGMVNAADPSKDYVVQEFPGLTQGELFNRAKSFVVTTYASGKDVMSISEPDIISIMGKSPMQARLGAFNLGSVEITCTYKLLLAFKDGKIRINFQLLSMGGMVSVGGRTRFTEYGLTSKAGEMAIFNKRGDKVKDEKAKYDLEALANNLTAQLCNALKNAPSQEEW